MKYILLILCFTLISCTTHAPIPYQYEEVNRPDINLTVTAEIGDSLLDYYFRSTSDAHLIVETTSELYQPTGSTLKPINSQGEFIFYKNVSTGNALCRRLSDGVWGGADGLSNCQAFTFGVSKGVVSTRPIKYVVTSSPNFKQELIYNGRVGDNVKIIYREFSNEYARPSFTQELQYDLSTSNQIGFKGARLYIEQASNMQITYRVIKTFER
jgi:hypothetical protein